MPAPLAKGTGSPYTMPPRNAPSAHHPNHPLTSGLIIAASVIVAAGIAIYESPQVRAWADQTRRKIAVALHSLGDDIQPRRPSESSDDFEERKRGRDELVRRNRNELIKRAREEGVAVDLDELARIGTENAEAAEKRSRADQTKSFDDMVGSDGNLKNNTMATGTETPKGDVRKRGAAGFAAGSAAAAAMANPFSDDQTLLDNDDQNEAPSPKPFAYEEPNARESTATLQAAAPSTPATATLVDLTPAAETPRPTRTEPEETDQAAQSFYSFTSSHSSLAHLVPAPEEEVAVQEEVEHLSTGTLTPRSERSMTMAAASSSSSPSSPRAANFVDILSMQNDTDHDARSEIFSEGGFTDAFSEGGFSEFEDERRGVLTPNSWTDVGSDDGSEWGGAAGGNGHVSQIHQ
ncbi:acetyl- C-acyltransferase [Pyrenophora seminiperda CCB06]|uniref:Acetyl-C-acyltransferase n=1 Tax=Pyrenophora seminiperda CCB06 TaxID=1302712 RepID=A0A3M7MBI1_9PLEO|nr:acetyl- C-acyltransferase [Pyrenophora seminiperda CCB06]